MLFPSYCVLVVHVCIFDASVYDDRMMLHADVEDNVSAETAPRRKSMPEDHKHLLTVTPTMSIGRSNSFKMLKSMPTANRLSPSSAEGRYRCLFVVFYMFTL